MINPLDGTGQITAISALIAVIAYLRNVPMKNIQESVKNTKESDKGTFSGEDTPKRRARYYQHRIDAFGRLIKHSWSQIGLMTVVLLLSIRILSSILRSYEIDLAKINCYLEFGFFPTVDVLLGLLFFCMAFGYLFLHIKFDWKEIRDSKVEIDKAKDALKLIPPHDPKGTASI